jgi:hypothetical protein
MHKSILKKALKNHLRNRVKHSNNNDEDNIKIGSGVSQNEIKNLFKVERVTPSDNNAYSNTIALNNSMSSAGMNGGGLELNKLSFNRKPKRFK